MTESTYKVLTVTEFERYKREWYAAIARIKRSRYPLHTIRITSREDNRV